MNKKKILKPNFLEILNSKAKPIKSFQQHNLEAQQVPIDVQKLEQEKKEIDLLRRQVSTLPRSVNTFLQAKYADGNFAQAEKDRYDNSEARIKAGISFEYHVFYPIDPDDPGIFTNNKYVITDKILDVNTGDHYYYHLPIRHGVINGIPHYKIDYFNEVITTDGKPAKPPSWKFNDNRIFYSLQTLANNLKLGNAQLPRDVYLTLAENKFMDPKTGKLNLAVKTGVLVEKYFLKFDSPEKKVYGLQYLEKEIEKIPVNIENPPEIITPEAVGEATTTTTIKEKPEEKPEEKKLGTEKIKVDLVDEVLPDLSIMPEEGKYKIHSFLQKPGQSRKKQLDLHPLPTDRKNIEDIVKKLRKRGINVKVFLGKSSAEFNEKFDANSPPPIPLCYGKNNIVFIYFRRYILGLKSNNYAKLAISHFNTWFNSLNEETMSTAIPLSALANLIKKEFPALLINNPAGIESVEPNDKNFFTEIFLKK